MPALTQHEHFMQMALRLARKGAGSVGPNPMVGAVVVKTATAVGQGYHKAFGGPHAEINALESAGDRARGADMYVNLEPCCHHGKTPPCVEALVRSGIRRVFIGMTDPNPAVGGRGIEFLRSAGLVVHTGLLEDACRRLNEAFVKYITRKVPFAVLKAAMTLDGKIAAAGGESKWITCEHSRREVHRMRAEADAVMVGVGTVIADDPLLTVRLWKRPHNAPYRIVVDSRLRIPLASKLLRSDSAHKTIVACCITAAVSARARRIKAKGAQVIGVRTHMQRIDLRALMQHLGRLNIASLLIEGGAELNAAALQSGIVDKVRLFYAPKILGGADTLSAVGGQGPQTIANAFRITDTRLRRIKEDFLVEGYVAGA